MNTEKIQWRSEVPGELTSSNEIHVWRVFVDTASFKNESLIGNLSADELTRAGQFYFERDRKRFIMARGVLRVILGHYLKKKPSELRFEYSEHGKPVLANNDAGDTLSFNLSHSGEIALYAVTRSSKIGVDVERIRDDIDLGLVAQRFFSGQEIRSLEKMDNKNQREIFFQYWARKEAFIKAKGEGISFLLEQCDVSSINGDVLSPITFQGENSESTCWYAQDLFPGHGYAAAIAVEGDYRDISCWHYSL